LFADGFVIPPTRWLVSLVTPLTVAAWGIRKKSLIMSGAVLGKNSGGQNFFFSLKIILIPCQVRGKGGELFIKKKYTYLLEYHIPLLVFEYHAPPYKSCSPINVKFIDVFCLKAMLT
jgi:hypothetical protein